MLVTTMKKMRLSLVIGILTIIFQISYGQKSNKKQVDEERVLKDTIDSGYIPKDLEDCFVQIDSFWDDSMKTQVKNWSEDEFSANTHFGFGMWIRNNWGLWGGSRLSKYFSVRSKITNTFMDE